MPRPVVFIVDDDRSVRRALARTIRWAGYDVETFASGAEFLASGRLEARGCLVLDLCMPGMSGLELQARLAEMGCTMSVILMSGYEDELQRDQAQQAGAIAFLRKPFSDTELMAVVQAALGRGSKERAFG